MCVLRSQNHASCLRCIAYHRRHTLLPSHREQPLQPPPAPRPPIVPLPADPAAGSHADYWWHRSQDETQDTKAPRKGHHVHFAPSPAIFNFSPSAPPHESPPERISHAADTPPHTPAPALAPAGVLHDILLAFPQTMWNVRERASPAYDPLYSARFHEPAFPHDATKFVTEVPLVFAPPDTPDVSWAIIARARPFSVLTVHDVLRAASAALFSRTIACTRLGARDRGAARADGARRVRSRAMPSTGRPVSSEDRVRNVDLYGADSTWPALYFRGLRPERQHDGNVVYVVQLHPV